MEKANECRRCWAQVGDWATDAGWDKGNECLDTYEPSFREACGPKMDAWKEGGYTDTNIQGEVDTCWEEIYLRTMAEKCAESTEDMNMGPSAWSSTRPRTWSTPSSRFMVRRSAPSSTSPPTTRTCSSPCLRRVTASTPTEKTLRGRLSA